MSFKIDLQVHLFKNKGIELIQILKKMQEREIDAIGLLYYKWEIDTLYSIEEMKENTKEDYIVEQEGNVLSFISKDNAKQLFIVLGEETASRNWHILSIGATKIEGRTINELINDSLGKKGITIIDHPFADIEMKYRDIELTKEEKLHEICRKFKGVIALEWNGYCNKWARYGTSLLMHSRYTDVNKKVEKIGEKMEIPVVPTTDLHIKGLWSLNKIGTAYIEVPKKNIDLNNLIGSLNENILSFNFKAHKKTVPLIFFGINYGLPLLIS